MSHTGTSPLTPLENLPQELHDLIISYLDDTPLPPPWINVPNLPILSRTCKALRAACMRAMFKDVDVTARISSMFEGTNVTASMLKRGFKIPRRFCPRRVAALTEICKTSSTYLATHIKKMRIDNLNTGDQFLEQLLPHTRCLMSLSINYEISCMEIFEAMRHSITHISKALTSSLTELAITNSYTSFVTSGVKIRRSSVPYLAYSCTHLTLLERLDIPPSVLLGWRNEDRAPLSDILPPSLVELHLGKEMWHQFKDDPVHEVICDLVEHGNWRHITPKLGEVSCHSRCGGSLKKLQANRKALKDLLERNGLHYNEDMKGSSKKRVG